MHTFRLLYKEEYMYSLIKGKKGLKWRNINIALFKNKDNCDNQLSFLIEKTWNLFAFFLVTKLLYNYNVHPSVCQDYGETQFWPLIKSSYSFFVKIHLINEHLLIYFHPSVCWFKW